MNMGRMMAGKRETEKRMGLRPHVILGGDLAYQYNLNGTLAGIGLGSAQTVINDASFGVSAQQLHPLAGLQTGAVRLG